MVYIYVYLTTIMEQKLDFNEQQQEAVSLNRSIDNLFTELLEEKNRLAEFDILSKTWTAIIDGEYIRVDTEGKLHPKGFVAKISQILKIVVKPTQNIVFRPILSGG